MGGRCHVLGVQVSAHGRLRGQVDSRQVILVIGRRWGLHRHVIIRHRHVWTADGGAGVAAGRGEASEGWVTLLGAEGPH